MRKLLAVLGVALAAAACDRGPTVPADEDIAASLEEMAGVAWGVTQVAEGPGAGLVARLNRLPPELALTSAQAARIRSLLEAFVRATADDRAALAAILRAADEARRAGRPLEEVRAILSPGHEIRARLHEAEMALHRSILAVLTPAQIAWLTRHAPPPPRACALTDAQRTEISGLVAAFETTHAADIALVRSVHDRARAAHLAGAAPREVAAILAEAGPALERLRAARVRLHEAIQGVLTTEQRAAGCLR